MKVLAGLLYSGVALHVNATSPTAYVYTSSTGQASTSSKRQIASISSNTARLVFAQQLGLSHYHSLENADEDEIRILNRYGRQEPMFLDEEQETRSERLLVFIEDVEHREDLIDMQKTTPAFTIRDPAPAHQNLQLATDLLAQDQHWRSKDTTLCSLKVSKSRKLYGGVNGRGNALKQCSLDTDYAKLLDEGEIAGKLRFLASKRPSIYGATHIFHFSMLEGLSRKDEKQYLQATKILRSFIYHFLENPYPNQESTIVFMPPQSKTFKRTSSSPYGTYSTPSQSPHLRQRQSEEPLTPTPKASSTINSSPSFQEALKARPFVKGVLSICHNSLKACIATTNNCSGHGVPYLKYSKAPSNASKASSEAAQACYACNCTITVRKNKDGTVKTTQWGGPACQKRNVSVPFWLLAGFSIALVATLSWAVGLLFSIGQEDLPSVIGAGVAGPRAQK